MKISDKTNGLVLMYEILGGFSERPAWIVFNRYLRKIH